MHAFEKGFDGVFIAADGHECSYSSRCSDFTNEIIVESQNQMKKRNINPKRIRMSAICSVCAEPFAAHMENFTKILFDLGSIKSELEVRSEG